MEKITIHESSSSYSPVEAALLKQAYNELELKAQKGELTIEETRIRVAYLRYQREADFKIAVRAATNKKPKQVKEAKPRKPRAKTRKTKKELLIDDIARASQLLFRKNNGETLSAEEESFLQMMTEDPPAP